MINKNIIQFNSFLKIDGLIHGFSTRAFGSMRPDDPDSGKSLSLFSKALEINPQHIIKMQQIHSDNIRWVTQKDTGFRIDQVDGLLTSDKNTYLSVLAADCIPILIFDMQKKYLGIVHAGWKGIEKEILKRAINELIIKGTNPKDVLIGIGPCIRACCYNITGERANLFNKKFGEFTSAIKNSNGVNFLDLPEIAKYQLRSLGVSEKNIEDCDICTFDNNDRLFSFRKEGQRFGEFVGIIGRRE